MAACRPYQLDEAQLALASPGLRGAALPARAPRRGDHRRGARRAGQRVWDEAENRRHAQKALLALLLERRPGDEPEPGEPGQPGHQDRPAGQITAHPGQHGRCGRRTELAELLAQRAACRSPRRRCPATWSSSARCGCAAPTAGWSTRCPASRAAPARGRAASPPADPSAAEAATVRPQAGGVRPSLEARLARLCGPSSWSSASASANLVCCAPRPGRRSARLGRRPRGLAGDPRHRGRRRHHPGHRRSRRAARTWPARCSGSTDAGRPGRRVMRSPRRFLAMSVARALPISARSDGEERARRRHDAGPAVGRPVRRSGPAEALSRRSVSPPVRLAAGPLRSRSRSRAHARVLHRAGLLTDARAGPHARRAGRPGRDVAGPARSGPPPTDEDVHTALERGLLERIGPLGGKLRAGRAATTRSPPTCGCICATTSGDRRAAGSSWRRAAGPRPNGTSVRAAARP